MMANDPSLNKVIRMATTADEPEIWRLCTAMHAEQETHHQLDWDRIVPTIRLATAHTRGIIGVIGPVGDLKGAVFLVQDQIWFSNSWHLIEYFNYVDAPHRKSNYAKELINYSKACADALGMELFMAVHSNIRTEAKVRLYKRTKGFQLMGAYFRYTPERLKLAQAAPANTIAAE